MGRQVLIAIATAVQMAWEAWEAGEGRIVRTNLADLINVANIAGVATLIYKKHFRIKILLHEILLLVHK